MWTSSTVLSATQKAYGGSKGWEIQVQRPDGTIRTFEDVPHLILATGFGGGGANFPKYPGMVRPFKHTLLFSEANYSRRTSIRATCCIPHSIRTLKTI